MISVASGTKRKIHPQRTAVLVDIGVLQKHGRSSQSAGGEEDEGLISEESRSREFSGDAAGDDSGDDSGDVSGDGPVEVLGNEGNPLTYFVMTYHGFIYASNCACLFVCVCGGGHCFNDCS